MATTDTKKTRRPRGSIDATMILEGAFDVARRDGLDAMSMPSLAAHLKVGVTSIYWYYRNKEELLQRMHAHAMAEIEQTMVLPTAFTAGEWRTYLFQLFTRLHAVFGEDNLLAELILQRHASLEHHEQEAYTRVEAAMHYLVGEGFDALTAWNVYATLWMVTLHHATLDRAKRRSGFPPEGDAQLTMIHPPTMPVLAKLVTEEKVSLDFTGATFEAGLNLILDAAALRLTAR